MMIDMPMSLVPSTRTLDFEAGPTSSILALVHTLNPPFISPLEDISTPWSATINR